MPATDGAVCNIAAENIPGSCTNHFSLTGMVYYKGQVLPAGVRRKMLHINTSLHSSGHKAEIGIF